MAWLSAFALAACAGPDRPVTDTRPSAVVAPALSVAQSFSVLAGQSVTNTGPTTIVGDLGLSPGTSVTGFPPGLVSGGVVHAADAVALQAQADLTASYLDLAGRPCGSDSTGIDLAGRTLTAGTYCFTSAALLSGTLVLDAQGSPDAVFVFQIASTLTTASGSTVRMINGGQACQVFWQVGSSATIGSGSTFVGTILALTSIDVATGATVAGRLLARNGSVTLDTNHVAIGACTGCTGTTCGDACVDTSTDAANCGACGHACDAGASCSSGVCAACAGTTCGGACVDTSTDTANCGACGHACQAGATCAAGACASAPPPACRDLGAAASFDVFSLGAFVGHDSAVQGAVAACGDFSAERYAIGAGLPPDSLALVIGRDLRYRQGSVNGDIIYGGELCWLCDVAVSGTVTRGSFLDCAEAGAYLIDYSASLAALPANGTTTLVGSTIFLAGSDATLDVFTVPGAMLSGATGVDLQVPAGAHALVVVTGGGTVFLTNQTWNLNGLPDGRLLLDFPSATQLDLQGTSIAGTILAPLAGVWFDCGVVTGQIVAGSFIGSGQVGTAPYDACVDVP